MLGRVKLYLAAVGAAILGLLAIYWRGKSAGAAAERDATTRRRVQAMERAKEVEDEIASDPYVVDRARRWVRDTPER